MVNELESHIIALKSTYREFLLFLKESKDSINNKSELIEYINFVDSKTELFHSYLDSLNAENSVHLYGLIGGICRYFSEFNWFEDNPFSVKAQDFKNKLTEQSYFIYKNYEMNP